ncbi:uncharacterized protein LOC114749683 [Neltuma alba]|uniref:uncharacterized protein LOC114749683 n=1 Tax=Neltuma alba TaxID=207710 RepID=UPI0010A3DF19|nr:uncharacterized protein LOC114749683 [Prosopis alba]
MEVPVINRIKDVHVGLTSLQNPSFSSGVQSLSFAYTFCKWSALILALVATFGSLINKINVLIVTFRRHSPPLPSIPLLNGDDYSSSDEDEEEEEETSSSLSSPSSEFGEEEDDETTTPSSSLMSPFNWRMAGDEDFRVRGSGHRIDDRLQSGSVRLRRRRSIRDIFSLSEIVNSKSVVKLWDSIGFGLSLDFEDDEISVGSLSRPPPAGSSSPSPVVLSAEKNASGKTAVKIWDSRLRQRLPAVIAEWKPNLGKIVGVGFGEVEKFYVRDDVHDDVTMGDLRNVSSPLRNVTESDADTWWDTDAVIVSAEN